MIEESEVEKAVWFLRDGEKIARARAEMVRTEAMLRHIKALVMAHSNEKSIAAREAYAYASDRYRDAIDEYAKAVEQYEILRSKREAAMALIQAWQSMSANARAIRL
jgi:hypothetical protein